MSSLFNMSEARGRFHDDETIQKLWEGALDIKQYQKSQHNDKETQLMSMLLKVAFKMYSDLKRSCSSTKYENKALKDALKTSSITRKCENCSSLRKQLKHSESRFKELKSKIEAIETILHLEKPSPKNQSSELLRAFTAVTQFMVNTDDLSTQAFENETLQTSTPIIIESDIQKDNIHHETNSNKESNMEQMLQSKVLASASFVDDDEYVDGVSPESDPMCDIAIMPSQYIIPRQSFQNQANWRKPFPLKPKSIHGSERQHCIKKKSIGKLKLKQATITQLDFCSTKVKNKNPQFLSDEDFVVDNKKCTNNTCGKVMFRQSSNEKSNEIIYVDADQTCLPEECKINEKSVLNTGSKQGQVDGCTSPDFMSYKEVVQRMSPEFKEPDNTSSRRRTLTTEYAHAFDMLPSNKNILSNPKYKGDTIRKKDTRMQLEGVDCDECKQYYQGVSINKNIILNACSRHRDRFDNDRGDLNKFWNLDMTTATVPMETQDDKDEVE